MVENSWAAVINYQVTITVWDTTPAIPLYYTQIHLYSMPLFNGTFSAAGYNFVQRCVYISIHTEWRNRDVYFNLVIFWSIPYFHVSDLEFLMFGIINSTILVVLHSFQQPTKAHSSICYLMQTFSPQVFHM